MFYPSIAPPVSADSASPTHHAGAGSAATTSAQAVKDEQEDTVDEGRIFLSSSGGGGGGAELFTSLMRKPESMSASLAEVGFEPGYGCLLSLVLQPQLNEKVMRRIS